MKVLELQLPEQTASKLQEAAERLSVSPEQLLILSIEEKLAQLEDRRLAALHPEVGAGHEQGPDRDEQGRRDPTVQPPADERREGTGQ